jgi:RNA polymerase sigma-70 factor (ECF subfamily)
MNFSSPEFIERLKSLDDTAFELIIDEYQMALFKAAVKLKLDFDQAEEVVQETWSTFFQKIHKFEGRSHVRTYLFGILYNKIKETWRSNKKYTHEYSDEIIEKLFSESGHYIMAPKDPSSWIENKDLFELIQKHLNQLPENQRMAFYLKEIQGEKGEVICKILGVSVTNLGVLIYRAKNKLRIAIEKELNA